MKLVEKVEDLFGVTVGGIKYDFKKYLPTWFLDLKFVSIKIDTENGNIFIEGKNKKEDFPWCNHYVRHSFIILRDGKVIPQETIIDY